MASVVGKGTRGTERRYAEKAERKGRAKQSGDRKRARENGGSGWWKGPKCGYSRYSHDARGRGAVLAGKRHLTISRGELTPKFKFKWHSRETRSALGFSEAEFMPEFWRDRHGNGPEISSERMDGRWCPDSTNERREKLYWRTRRRSRDHFLNFVEGFLEVMELWLIFYINTMWTKSVSVTIRNKWMTVTKVFFLSWRPTLRLYFLQYYVHISARILQILINKTK